MDEAFWKFPPSSSIFVVAGTEEAWGLRSYLLPTSSWQGGRSGERRESPAVQRNPQEEEGEEGEETTEERRRLQPAGPHLLHT